MYRHPTDKVLFFHMPYAPRTLTINSVTCTSLTAIWNNYLMPWPNHCHGFFNQVCLARFCHISFPVLVYFGVIIRITCPELGHRLRSRLLIITRTTVRIVNASAHSKLICSSCRKDAQMNMHLNVGNWKTDVIYFCLADSSCIRT